MPKSSQAISNMQFNISFCALQNICLNMQRKIVPQQVSRNFIKPFLSDCWYEAGRENALILLEYGRLRNLTSKTAHRDSYLPPRCLLFPSSLRTHIKSETRVVFLL